MRTLLLALLVAGCGSGSGSAPIEPVAPLVSVPLPAAPPPMVRRPAPGGVQARLDALLRGFPGKAGAAIRAVDGNWEVESGGRQLLPQQSVSKLWVAMTVLDQRDQGRLKLDDPVTVTPADLTLFHQPIAYIVASKGSFASTVQGLMTRALTQSDNTANDRLLTLVGGPSAVRAFIAKNRLGAIRFGPGERLLQAGTAGLTWNQSMSTGGGFEAARSRLPMATRVSAFDRYVANPPDGAAPEAIVEALSRFARGELLSETSTRVLLDTMGQTRTGRARLKAATPPGWTLQHKTGTGQDLAGRNAGFNDIGLLTAPDGRRYAIAVQIGDTRAPMRTRQLLIQSVAALVTGARAGAVGAEASEGDG